MALTDKKYKRFILLALSGVLTGLTVAFPRLGFLEWLTLAPMALLLLDIASDESAKLRYLYGYGLFFFMSFYLVIFHWFVNLYPLEFIDGMTKGGALCVVLLASVGLSLFQALQGAFVFVLAALLFRAPLAKRLPWCRPLLAAALWSVYEWTQTIGWWGVPWGRLPIGQSEYLVGLQTASWFGSYFITFVIVAVNFFVAYGLMAFMSREKTEGIKGIRIASLACGVILLFQYGAGLAIWFTAEPEKGEKITVAAIQGNIPSGEKWENDTETKTLSVYRNYTLLAAEQGADVVVWPETAFPWTIKEGNKRYKYISELAEEAGVTILAGAFTNDEDGNEYNSIVCFTPDGKMSDTVYNKRHLVPFGEFVPFGGLIETLVPPLAELVMSEGDVAAGEGANIFNLDQGNLGSIICFDSIYESLTLESVREGAELICLSTNDSWFTDSAALYMHNAQAQLRAIECGRYVSRAANTGISTAINSRGEVLSELEPLVEGMVIEELYLKDGRTLYSYIGNLFVYILAAILSVIVVWSLLNFVRALKKP